jgi:predicted enzyme related to lactoylglutathione lyase
MCQPTTPGPGSELGQGSVEQDNVQSYACAGIDGHEGGDQEREAQMPAKVGYLASDTFDPNGMAPFWRELSGVHVDMTIGDVGFVMLSPREDGLTIGLQQVPEAKSGKNRMPLDLVVADLDAATTEVEQLGGRWLAPGTTRELEGFRWRCVADPPEGNEFDLDVVPAGS